MSLPELMCQSRVYKSEHRETGETSIFSILSDAADILYALVMIGDNILQKYECDKRTDGKGFCWRVMF